MRILSGRRILICGKGGSGKSSVTALLALALQDRHYNVLLLDGDASNPGGLARLVLGSSEGPAPLIEFFGGRERVTCPVDDPSPLTRASDSLPVVDAHIALQEIPPRYFVRSGNVLLFQVGKIRKPYEGCDGPMSKVTRDFVLNGGYVTVIDMEAGIEHFGRGVEKHIDMVLVVVDPTYESFEIATRVTTLCSLMSITHALAILNEIDSPETESAMRRAMEMRHVSVLGSVSYDPAVRAAGMNGQAISRCRAGEEVAVLVQHLEEILPSRGAEGTP
jgi:CO dehydrogenase maturation factor